MAKKVFKKGEPKLPNSGRVKGVPNKKTVAQREAFDTIMELIEKRLINGDDVINNLSVGRAADLYIALVNYKKPKLSANSNTDSIEHSGAVEIKVSFEDFGVTKGETDEE